MATLEPKVVERRYLCRPDHAEVAVVERRNGGLPETLGQGDQAGIGAAERKIRVSGDKSRDSVEIFSRQTFNRHVTSGNRLEEVCLGLRTYPAADEIRGFGDDEWRRMERL